VLYFYVLRVFSHLPVSTLDVSHDNRSQNSVKFRHERVVWKRAVLSRRQTRVISERPMQVTVHLQHVPRAFERLGLSNVLSIAFLDVTRVISVQSNHCSPHCRSVLYWNTRLPHRLSVNELS
jgi:hypothetical protein